MASNFQRQKRKGRGALSSLDVDIQTLDRAKDTCGMAPVQAVFGSSSALLATIRVHFVLSYDNELPVHICLGNQGQQKGLC